MGFPKPSQNLRFVLIGVLLLLNLLSNLAARAAPEMIGRLTEAQGVVEITQYGSTRSINASAAAAVVMYEWCRRWA